MSIARPLIVAAMAAVLAAGLGACREQEQGRPLSYDKGVYGGQQDESLSEEARERLRQRHGLGW